MLRGAALRSWLEASALELAPQLLGSVLTTRRPEGRVTLRLTEVEAYEGSLDPGSHAYRGPTARNRVMFGEPGHLYVYRHLGLHHCANLVCGPAGTASAVLLRAGEVIDGADLARARRTATGVCRTDVDLARGPARLTVALGLGIADDGADVCAPRGAVALAVELGSATEISAGARVGVSGAGGSAARHPWRFWISGALTVSAYRRAPERGVGRTEG